MTDLRVNTFTTGNQSNSSVAMDADGDFVVVWNSEMQEPGGSLRGVYAQRYTAAGVKVGDEFLVNTTTANFQEFPTVAMDAAGNFVVTWSSALQDGSEDGIYAQRYTAAGVKAGGEFQVNTTTAFDQSFPSVAMDDAGNFVIAWQSEVQDGSGWGIYARRYDASGVAVSGEVLVNTTTASFQTNPVVAMDSTGDFVVVWQSLFQDGSGYGIYAQRFDSAGAKVGSELAVNTTTDGSQNYPAVAMDADGDFVVVWQSATGDGDGYGVFAQRYTADGVATGGEFQVNTTTANNQAGPSVAMDAAGNFVVTWASDGQDGSSYGIYAQRYSAAGVAIGGEVLINTTTAGGQWWSAVAMDDDGDFAVTWTSNGQDGSGWGVFLKTFSMTSPSTPTLPATVFAASDATNGIELWITDGTDAGTRLVKDIQGGAAGSNPFGFTALGNGKVVFRANDGVSGTELWITDGTEAGTTLLKNIDGGSGSSYPYSLTALGDGRVLFGANDGVNGRELWVTDGTENGTVRLADIYAGPYGSNPLYVTPLGNGKALFTATSAQGGAELWITDGTEGGTLLVKDIAPGNIGSNPDSLIAFGNGLAVFRADDGSGNALWITNGTEAGTLRFSTLLGGSNFTAISTDFGVLGDGRVVFSAFDAATTGYEPWITDGTETGTTLLKDIFIEASSSNPAGFTPLGDGRVVFRAYDGVNGRELWVTDGTNTGTTLLKDLRVGSGSSNPFSLTALGDGRVLFSADDGVNGFELWITNGTAGGTTLLKDIAAGGDSNPTNLTALGDGRVVFSAGDVATGEELWITNGTEAGTTLVKDIRAGGGSSNAYYVTALGDGRAVFMANDGSGNALWITDGTAAGTAKFSTLLDGATSPSISTDSAVVSFAATNQPPVVGTPLVDQNGAEGAAFTFVIPAGTFTDPDSGDTLTLSATLANGNPLPSWLGFNATTGTFSGTPPFDAAGDLSIRVTATDGSASVFDDFTLAIANTNQPPVVGTPLPDQSATAGAAFTFAIPPGTFTDPDSGDTLTLSASLANGDPLPSWLSFNATTGTFTGTPPRFAPSVEVRVTATDGANATVQDSFALSVATPRPMKTLFSADDGTTGLELWVTDGTAAGTRLVADINVGPDESNPVAYTSLPNGKVVFSAVDDLATLNRELWITDGTAAGTVLVKDINPTGPGSPFALVPLDDGRVVFSANDGVAGRELWVTDGTEVGTVLLKEIRPGSVGSYPDRLSSLGNGLIVFVAEDGVNGRELWVTDGTAAETKLLKNIYPAAGQSSNPTGLVSVGNGTAVFAADDGVTGRELWITNGTAAGTVRVQDIRPGASGGMPENIVAIGGGKVLFSADNGTSGRELWISDGTGSGTTLVKDIQGGAADSNPFGFTALGNGKVVFRADDGVHGEEIWVTDGTTAGTALLKDIATEAGGSSTPRHFVALGDGRVLFNAEDAVNGRELWVTDGTTIGTKLVKDVTPGLPGSFAPPSQMLPVDMVLTIWSIGGGRAAFQASDGANGFELWVTDGTPEGTSLLKDINPGSGSGTPDRLSTVVLNTAPTVTTPLPDSSVAPGGTVNLNLAANFSDPDAPGFDTLTFSATLDGGGALPSWLSIDPATGVLSGTAPGTSQGTLAIRVTATDEFGASASDGFTLALGTTGRVLDGRVNTYVPNNQGNAAVAMDDAGNYVITWNSFGQDGSDWGVFGQRYDAAGQKVGAEFQVNTTTDSNQMLPTVAMDADGDFVVAWRSYLQDGSGWGIFGQRYTAAGEKAGAEFQVNTTTSMSQREPAVAMDDAGNFVVTWMSFEQDGDGWGIYAQRYDAAGAKVGGEFKVSTATPTHQAFPAVAMDADGDFVVTWQSGNQDGSGYGIYAQRYTAAGAPAGAEFRVNTTTAGNQQASSVAMDADGDFVVAWQSADQDGSGWGIYAQRYTAAGNAVGGEFLVNTTTANNQANPSVAMDGAGNFRVTWQSNLQDGSGYGIFTQRFDAAGNKVGGEVQVNPFIIGPQTESAVAMGNGGQFAIAWQSHGQDTSGPGVFHSRSLTVVQPGGSIQAAIDAANDGDTIVIAAGTYNEAVLVTRANLTILGANAGKAGTDGTRGAETKIVGGLGFMALQADGITIDGVEFVVSGDNRGITTGISDGATIRNSVFTAGDSHPLTRGISGHVTFFPGGTNPATRTAPDVASVTVENNLFRTQYGFAATEFMTGLTIRNNVFQTGTEAIGFGVGVSLANVTGNSFTSGTQPQNYTASVITLGANTVAGTAVGNVVLGTGQAVLPTTPADNTIAAAAGNQVISGQTGTDTYDASGATAAVTVNLSTGVATGASIGTDQLISIENVIGSNFADTIIGDAEANVLSGGAGDDSIAGGGGADTLNGGTGNDTIRGGDSADVINGGDGDDVIYADRFDTIDGGADQDIASFVAGTTIAEIAGRVAASAITNVEVFRIDPATAGGAATYVVLDGMSIQAAINAAAVGDTIIVAAGTYNETLTINKDVTLQGNNIDIDGWATRNPESIIQGRVTITADGAELNGFKLTGTVSTNLIVAAGADDVLVTSNIVEVNAHPGGYARPGHVSLLGANGTFEGNWVKAAPGYNWQNDPSGTHGVEVVGSGNTIHNNHLTVATKGSPALTVTGTSSAVANTTITSNYMGGDVALGVYGMWWFGDLEIRDNEIDLPDGWAVLLWGPVDTAARTITIDNNTIDRGYIGVDSSSFIDYVIDGASAQPLTTSAQLSDMMAENPGAGLVLVQQYNNTVPGNFNSIVRKTFTFDGVPDFNLVQYGDARDNTLGSTPLNDLLFGNGGNDLLKGDAGIDTAGFATAITRAMLSTIADADPDTAGNQAGWRVTTGGAEGTDTLLGMEIVDGAEGGRILLVGSGGFATIQAAVDAAIDGDTIVIIAGTYNEEVTVSKANLTFLGANAGIAGNGARGPETIITGSVGDTWAARMWSLNGDGITIDGIEFVVSGNNRGIAPDGDGITIRNSVFSAGDANPISRGIGGWGTTGADSLTVERNLFKTQYGVAGTEDMAGLTIRNNVFQTGTEAIGFGIGVSLANVTGNSFTSGTQPQNYTASAITLGSNTVGGTVRDNVVLGTGRTELTGIPADNIILAAPGNQVISGQAGIDTYDASGATGGVTINLSTGVATGTSIGTDQLISIENVIVSRFVNTIIGDSGNNVLRGGDGNDTIRGDGGNDTITGGSGVNFLRGSEGDDVITGGDQGDRLYGDAGDDTINGGAGADDIRGGIGHDTLHGGGGNDTSTGGEGNDTITGGSGVNFLRGQQGDDVVTGGDQGDRLFGDVGDDTIYGGAGADDIRGGIGNDTLNGGGGNDAIRGGDGDDVINGGAGNDELVGGIGNDTLTGGDGVDIAVIIADNGGVALDPAALNVAGLTVTDGVVSGTVTGPDGTDTLSGIEFLKIANTGSDTFYVLAGMSIQAAIDEANEGDTIFIAAGTHTGDVTVTKQLTILGAKAGIAGTDASRAPVRDVNGKITAEAAGETVVRGKWTVSADGAEINGLVFASNVTGDAERNRVNLWGDDIVFQNNQFLDFSGAPGGVGSQIFQAGKIAIPSFLAEFSVDGTLLTNNLFERRGGSENLFILMYDANFEMTNNTFNFGPVGLRSPLQELADSPQLSGSELIITGNTFNTTGVPSNEGNRTGVSLAVDLRGGDIPIQEAIAEGNLVVGGNTFLGTTPFRVRGTALDDDFTSLATPSADVFFGNDGNDILVGAGGDDVLDGGAGDDVIDGGAGNDTITGGAGNDTLIGGSGINFLRGGDGDDVITGGDEGDRLYGDEGNDTITGGAGADDIRGGVGNDTIRGGGGNDTITGGAGVNFLRGGDGDDVITGGDEGDRLYGDAGDDTITGGAGADDIRGGIGNDTLNGGGGNDTILGGLGADIMTGGAGADRFVFNEIADSTVATPDRILDFVYADGDRIDLVGIDADTTVAGNSAFTWIGVDAVFTGAGQLRATQDGGTWIVEGNVNADPAADFRIIVTATTTPSADWFLL